MTAHGTGDVLLEARGSASDVVLNADLSSGTGHVSLIAGDDVHLTADVSTDGSTPGDGSVLIVSHDRAVLRGLATQVWELRNNALTVFPGTFVEWEQMRAEREKRAVILTSEGERDAKVNQAEGEKQRVIIASALSQLDRRNLPGGRESPLLLLDEPTAALELR